MTETKKGMASKKPVDLAGCHPTNTTNISCSLQVQKQKELNSNLSMFDETKELFVGNVFTEEELDAKIQRMIDYGHFTPPQLDKIHRYFAHVKETGWFDKFMYRGFLCAVTLDEMGRWRVFVKYQYNSQRDIFYTEDDGCYRDSARCGVKGFPLGLWDYGDKIGLDDFIGLCTLVESEMRYDYFDKSRLQRKVSEKRAMMGFCSDWKGNSLLDIRTPTKMVKLLVDRFRKEVMKLGLPLDE